MESFREFEDLAMQYETLRFEIDRLIASIRLLRPAEEQNELAQLSAELSECCQRFREDHEARVLMVTGGSREAFSMGDGLLKAGIGEDQTFSIAEPLAAVERPVIASISGNAIGSGLELALACDVRVGCEGALFGMPHVRLEVMPWDGGTQRLLRTVGKGKALEMILPGEPIDAREAQRIGLLTLVVPENELSATLTKMAQDMAPKSPISMEYCKEAINKGWTSP
jgi:enoyl-CoA hydratase/carnithine racemase